MLRRTLAGAAIIPAISLCFQVASAGEYGTPKSEPSPIDVYNWSGFYAGAHVGGVWGRSVVRDNARDGVDPGPFSYAPSGAFGGGTGGYNWQIQKLVLGIEADLGYMDLSGSGIIGSSHAASHQDLTLDGGLYGDVTGRAGILVSPTTLLYGKGGFAFYDGEAKQATTNPGYAPTGTDTFTGWTAGGGIEHFITPNLSLKVEYLHFDFGSQEGYQTALVADPPTPAGYKFRNWTDLTADSVKAGIAYHF